MRNFASGMAPAWEEIGLLPDGRQPFPYRLEEVCPSSRNDRQGDKGESPIRVATNVQWNDRLGQPPVQD